MVGHSNRACSNSSAKALQRTSVKKNWREWVEQNPGCHLWYFCKSSALLMVSLFTFKTHQITQILNLPLLISAFFLVPIPTPDNWKCVLIQFDTDFFSFVCALILVVHCAKKFKSYTHTCVACLYFKLYFRDGRVEVCGMPVFKMLEADE